MKITYENKEHIGDLYLHDFNIIDFKYSDEKRAVTMKLNNDYLKKEVNMNFFNISYCEIDGMEKLNDPTGDIIDWYELADEPRFFDYSKNIKPVGIMIVKASITTIKIYCEKIEIEEINY